MRQTIGMQKIKVAIIGVKYFPSRGGVSRVVEDTLMNLKDRFEFTIYCYSHAEAEGHIPGVKVVQIPEHSFGGAGVFMYYWKCTQHVLKHGDYDLVHVHKTDAAYFVPMLAKKFEVIATSHEAPYKRDKWSSLGKAYFRKMEKTFMSSEALLTSISKPLADFYEEKYGREVMFIPNGVDTEVHLDFDRASQFLEKNGVNGPFVFFAARRIMGTKGCHHMLKALKKVNYQGNVVIAGDMTQLPAYSKQLEEMSKGMNVHFIGYVDSKEALLALVDQSEFFFFPSETEGMSIMLLEVASVGTPVICSDIPENTAVFDEDEVLYFTNKDADDLAEKFTWAQANREEMANKAARAKLRISKQYDRMAVAERYAELYESTAKIASPDLV